MSGMAGSPSCGFCRRRLAGEFYYTCLGCEASYCYIHASRHPPSSCRPRLEPEAGVPVILPRARGRVDRSSANV